MPQVKYKQHYFNSGQSDHKHGREGEAFNCEKSLMANPIVQTGDRLAQAIGQNKEPITRAFLSFALL